MTSAAGAGAARRFPQQLEIITAPEEVGSEHDADATAESARRVNADWVVIDGYAFGRGFETRLQSVGLHTLAIDDRNRGGPHSADIVVDPGLGVSPLDYPDVPHDCVVRAGIKYAPLRREFARAVRPLRVDYADAPRLLVTFGGSDPQNLTRHTLVGLRQIARNLEITVVIGPWYEHLDDLIDVTKDYPHKIQVHRDVKEPAATYADNDIAVSAGGTTIWELAALGIPSIVVATAENQMPGAQAAASANLVTFVGWHKDVGPSQLAEAVNSLLLAPNRMQAMSERGRSTIDGQGADRIADLIRCNGLDFRAPTPDDADVLWRWANDLETRKWSFSPGKIAWDTHQRWFATRLIDPRCVFLIATNVDGNPVGQVRFDLDGLSATLSVSVDPEFRGKGLSARILDRAARLIFRQTDVRQIRALVKVGNSRSSKAFARAHFRLGGQTHVGSDEAEIWLRDRPEIEVEA